MMLPSYLSLLVGHLLRNVKVQIPELIIMSYEQDCAVSCHPASRPLRQCPMQAAA